jgi:hypothetical protein
MSQPYAHLPPQANRVVTFLKCLLNVRWRQQQPTAALRMRLFAMLKSYVTLLPPFSLDLTDIHRSPDAKLHAVSDEEERAAWDLDNISVHNQMIISAILVWLWLLLVCLHLL